MPVFGIGGRDHSGDIAVGDQLDSAAERAEFSDDFRMARPVEHAGDDLVRLDALGGGDRPDILAGRFAQVDRAFGIAGADRQLFHIRIGRVQQAAAVGNRQHRERVGAGIGGQRRALERIERDVDLGAVFLAAADLLADVEHRRFVALALADHHRAGQRQLVERRAHRLDRRSVGGIIVAAPDPFRRGDGRGLGDSDHFEHQHTVEGRGCDGLGAIHRNSRVVAVCR